MFFVFWGGTNPVCVVRQPRICILTLPFAGTAFAGIAVSSFAFSNVAFLRALHFFPQVAESLLTLYRVSQLAASMHSQDHEPRAKLSMRSQTDVHALTWSPCHLTLLSTLFESGMNTL
jgi:hypothetical protein